MLPVKLAIASLTTGVSCQQNPSIPDTVITSPVVAISPVVFPTIRIDYRNSQKKVSGRISKSTQLQERYFRRVDVVNAQGKDEG